MGLITDLMGLGLADFLAKKLGDAPQFEGAIGFGGTAMTATAAEINRAADVSARLVTVAATPLAVSEATHEGKTVVLNLATGITATLPAATGSGAKYRFVVGTSASGGSYVIQVTGNDTMKGVSWQTQDSADTVVAFETAADSDTITLNGSTKGGLAGDVVELQDIAADVWAVQCHMASTGSEASPFSAAV